MTPALGQALRWAQRVIRVGLALGLLATIGLGLLAWRLAEGPIVLPAALERQIERAAATALAEDGEAGRVEIGRASIAWAGWRGGAAAPLDIHLTGLMLRGPDGRMRAEVPEATVTLSVAGLLRGRLLPATIELLRPSLLLYREPDGSLNLLAAPVPAAAADSPAIPPPPGAPATEAAATERQPLEAVLDDLVRPVGAGAPEAGMAGTLRRVRITDAQVLVVDALLGRRWTLADTGIELRRMEAGGLTAEGRATIRSGTLAVPVRIEGKAAGAPVTINARLSLPSLDPAALAALWPDLGPLSVLDAPVSLTVSADFATDAAMPRHLEAQLRGGPGALVLGASRQRLPFATLEARLDVTEGGRRLQLAGARLGLPGGAGAPALSASGEARMQDGAWSGDLRVEAGDVDAARLPEIWPEALAPEARAAAIGAVREGLLREARLRVALRAPQATPEALSWESAEASLRIEGARIDTGPLAGVVAAPELAVSARATETTLTLERLALRLPGPPAAPDTGPRLAATAEARRDVATAEARPDGVTAEARRDGATGWTASATLATEGPIRLGELAHAWPEGLRRNERRWLTTNVTDGTLTQGEWKVEARLPDPADLAGLQVTAVSGTAEARDATVHWLRPVPPVQVPVATASFSLDQILIRAPGGRQPVASPAPGGAPVPTLEMRESTVRFFDFDKFPGQAEIVAQAAGGLPELLTLLRNPRLKLFEKRKLELTALGGQAEARLSLGFQLLDSLPAEELRIRATGRVTDGRLAEGLAGKGVERANLDVTADTEALKVQGTASLGDIALRLGIDMDFRAGPPSQVIERATVTAAQAEPRQLAALGLDAGALLEGGTVALDIRAEKRRSGQGQAAIRADLSRARLGLAALGWSKAPGVEASAEATLRLDATGVTGIDPIRVDAPDLRLRGSARLGPEFRLNQAQVTEGQLGASRFAASLARPARAGAPWTLALRGPVLDLRPALEADRTPARSGAARDPADPPLALDLRFERVVLGGRGELHGVAATARTDEHGVLREAEASGRTAASAEGGGALSFSLTPRGQERQLRLTAADGGAFLEAVDLTGAIRGGRLSVNATYADPRPGAPLSGTAELDDFVLRDAPGFGKLLQAITVYGVIEAMQGGSGLTFMRLVAPFSLTRQELALTEARAFSASLGLTAKGRILREQKRVELEGTVVPAYFFNQLLGNIPILGRLFSPERGGGLFAATYRIQGPLADPTVSVNPLAALTPGFLRGVFGLGGGEQGGGGTHAAPPPAAFGER